MDDRMETLKADHTPEDLRPHLQEAGIDGTVAVQARQMVQETDYLLDISHRYNWVMGVVGWFDFNSESLEAQIEEYSSDPRLKGARELIHDMSDPEYAVSKEHVRAIGLLGEYGLTYDLLLRPQHIEPATRLVDRYPEQPFVIDHIAKPNIAQQELSPWRERMIEIGRRPNVYCKLSGMVTEAEWGSWTSRDFVPYMEICLEAFGPMRLMIGSDWPVCTLSGSYAAVMGIVRDFVGRLSESERRAILGETCVRFYGLEEKKESLR
jgi:L-fuconolactonase